jgi:hypothetical protein
MCWLKNRMVKISWYCRFKKGGGGLKVPIQALLQGFICFFFITTKENELQKIIVQICMIANYTEFTVREYVGCCMDCAVFYIRGTCNQKNLNTH